MHFFETAGTQFVLLEIIKTNYFIRYWYEENTAYFGSWILSHKVPKEQRDNIDKCDYILYFTRSSRPFEFAKPKTYRDKNNISSTLWESNSERFIKAGFNIITLPMQNG